MKEKRHNDPDLVYVHRCIKGDVDAFEEIVQKYQRKMFNTAFRMIGEYNDAAEVVQDAFLSAYRSIKDFKGRSRFSTWLHSIVINLSRNKIKQLQTRSYREDCSLDDPIDTENGQVTPEPASNNPSIQDRLEQNAEKQQVWKCINSLDAVFREVIVLRDIQGFSYDEISDMLKIAIGTVRSRIHRSRDAVRNCLKKLMGDL